MFFHTERLSSAARPFSDMLTKSGVLKIPYNDDNLSTIGSRCRLSGPWNESEDARDGYQFTKIHGVSHFA